MAKNGALIEGEESLASHERYDDTQHTKSCDGLVTDIGFVWLEDTLCMTLTNLKMK